MTSDANPPDGFEILQPVGGLTALVGPYFSKQGADGGQTLGFRARPDHLNMAGLVHGGTLMAFMDVVLGRTVVSQCGFESRPVTISLNSNFLKGSGPGDWIEGHGRIIRRTRSMVFLAGEALVDDQVIFTATGIWKLLNPAAVTA